MRRLIILAEVALGLLFASCTKEEQRTLSVIPAPLKVELQQEVFSLNSETGLYIDASEGDKKILEDYLVASSMNLKPVIAEEGHNVVLKQVAELPEVNSSEGYVLTVTPDQVLIRATSGAGLFYGVQTMLQMVDEKGLPAGVITDEPRFAYRGFMMDVSRHFFDKEFIKKQMDALAYYKLNRLHLHLTDAAGWRLEIKKYPRLTEFAAWREFPTWKEWWNNGRRYEEEGSKDAHGGYYTQDDIRELVAYAQERFITVIPEIEMPAHSEEVLTAYPELSCTHEPYKQADFCVGNEKTFEFLENVLTEVMELFPSEYIHIGGDEAGKASWPTCKLCQARMKKEGLKDVNELQSYLIHRIEVFLNAHGRKLLGWDEILEGDVAPNATVMSWRGMEGGIKAAQLGHDVIMTPTSFCYFDYYQTADTKDEPLGIGGYVPIEKVYSLEPVPAVLTEEQSKHILGAQANLWTEYIHSSEHVEYMVLPRMAALAEVQWTQPEKKDFKDFTKRLARLMKFYQRDGFNYAKHVFDLKVDFTPDVTKKAVVVTLSTIDDAPIYYTLDGTEPTTASLKYTEPVSITETADFQAVVIRPEGKSKVVNKKISFNKATYCPIELTFQPSEKYKFGGAITLVDGMKGNDSYATGAWLGFVGGNVEAIIDLGQESEIKQVATNAIVDMSAWIMGSTGLVVSISDDNKEFREVAAKDIPAETNIDKKGVENYEITFDPVKARYVKVVIKRSPALPKGHAGEGKAAYMFIDEIEVD